ncbi:MAG TPA: sugar ABC transporter ATP-binding protein [Verrucomicrobiae bacterium]|nr:sugar ABC transporter ATP-binding protein [Verrucomicrobiae bacterium]
MSPSLETRPLLAMRGIHKRFPGVHALRGADLDLRPGEVHALVGENGAGKSTLMHLLAGVYQPDAGVIDFDGGKDVRIADEHIAQTLGIAIVFQERSLFNDLTIAENIFAGRQPTDRWGRIKRSELFAQARHWMQRVNLAVSPTTVVRELSSAQQQMVEITKALSLRAKLMIFDEPTAALTDTETRALFGVIEQLKQQQVGIIYISHRLEEIFQVADRVTVLRDGENQGTFAVGETNPEHLISRMVGRELMRCRRADGPDDGPIALELRNVNGVSFSVRAGEVLAFAGLAGAGRTELALALFGAHKRDGGEVRLDGVPVQINSPADAIAAGIGYMPEDRKEAGLFLEMSVAQNIVSARLEDFREQESISEDFRKRLRIGCRSVHQPAQNLSGGNQQKVVLAKWLLANPKVLIVDEPTRGVDVGAKAEVHLLLRELARKGTAIIVISSDLPEVLAVADRVLVMREGRITGELAFAEATEERILRLAYA